ncbi:MAG: SirB2 family protein [Halofilum sp. (in: g-proteobacteria)]|nr:SirB2 family protein [Halofilum sp. (in: g-proteobacteria)]
MITALKLLHVSMAALSIAGFVLRGVWAWRRPDLLARRPTRIVPHIIDTFLLLAAVGLLVAYGWNPLAFDWLLAKIVLLLAYIGFGLVALKPWFGAHVRVPAFVAALGVFAWIVLIARAHALVPFADG